MLKSQAEKL